MTSNSSMSVDELREQLAAIEHERWADWQRWCHKVLRENNPSPEIGDVLERWDRQIETPYTELSEKEKDSDREQVDRYWHLINQYVTKKQIEERNTIAYILNSAVNADVDNELEASDVVSIFEDYQRKQLEIKEER